MPAIHLPRLRRQVAELAEKFDNPSAFTRALKDIFEYYSDRTRRPGQAAAPPPLIKTYQVPAPVLKRIYLEMAPIANAEPDKVLDLVETLWKEPVLEHRLIAIHIIGEITSQKQQRLLSLIETWVDENDEEKLLDKIASRGLVRFREENPEAFTSQVEKWLASKENKYQKLGLQALLAQLTTTEFENLPMVYRLLGTHLPVTSKGLRPYLLDLLRPLALRSPSETVYFLRQSLEDSDNPVIPWLIRRSMDYFPVDIQHNLKAALRGE
ncbi:MAG: DNA alkylation repair protein [Anaerolineales bacterium]|jgi:hypothetical protein